MRWVTTIARKGQMTVPKGVLSAYTSGLVPSEVRWALASFYRFGRPDALRALRAVVTDANLRVPDASDAQIALDPFARHRVKWQDCLNASAPGIRASATTVVSYDRDFDHLGVVRLEPAEALRWQSWGGLGSHLAPAGDGPGGAAETVPACRSSRKRR